MLEDQINQDYIKAMKDRDTAKSSALSFLRAQIKNYKIDSRAEKLTDEDIIKVIKKQVKQRQDSIEQYQKGARQDLVDKETNELNILKGYLPQEMGEDQLKGIVKEAVKETGAQSPNDMGKIMKALMPKVAGKADNKMVSDLVKKVLSEL